MCTILLRKDRKKICRTMCPEPPAKLPENWNLENIVPQKKIRRLSGLPQFTLHPTPECVHDQNEWERFLTFLHKHDMVAIAAFKQYKFFLLPPDEASTSSAVKVAYWMDKSSTLHISPRVCESGSQLDEGLGRSNTIMGRDSANGACHSMAEACSRPQSRGVMQNRHFAKNNIRVDPSYLKTLGQVHSGWIFGGIAELIDNSSDAKANKVDIFIEMIKFMKTGETIPILSVIDDGKGMNHEEIVKMVCFGHKPPDGHEPDRIGRFGIGFKTGAMRLGRDVLVLTQTLTSRSIAFLSQSFNEGKDNIEIPIVSYIHQGQCMEVDTSVQSEALAKYNLKAIQEFSPFNKYLIGEKAASFGGGTGTQIYIWNLDKWGLDCCLQWYDGLVGGSSFHQGDICIRSKRIRSRPGQISQKVPLDYSLRSYLEVIFLSPRMKISVQHSLVRNQPLANSLTKTVTEIGVVLGKHVELTLGFNQLEWEQANSGIFLYCYGRLIESYKRVGGMIHNTDGFRGVIGVIDVTDLMNEGNDCFWVHNNKQGFQDCESYAHLEQWLGRKVDEYFDNVVDVLNLDKENCVYRPHHEWVQCDKCRKWRMVPSGFNIKSLPELWFCYMEPFKGNCSLPEEKMKPGVVTVSAKRSGYDCNVQKHPPCKDTMENVNASNLPDNKVNSEDLPSPTPTLKRLKKGPPKSKP
ncbi:hypothetical protein L6164_020283 [Bauhinia variegata]|uniref:Uncharacterized protein n=1 Tax=Bauhinia variegata TaxID=167791 RepID=A0ACB9MW72_BAUVA|nr:hypothetical protein L6164_020283 [Bauhinia variegata]